MKTTLEMFKEIEDLEVAPDNEGEPLELVKDIVPNWCNKIEEAIQRLEAIDNSNPSEALECLEKLKGMEISSMPFSDEYGTQEVDLNDIRKVGSQLNTDFREYTATIKQVLLKAQEPKQYLKWEDLEFDAEEQTMKVSLNGSIHLLCYYRNMFGSLCMIDNTGITIWEDNKNFFNDLHLERVEE